jgi:hypothetical protein
MVVVGVEITGTTTLDGTFSGRSGLGIMTIDECCGMVTTDYGGSEVTTEAGTMIGVDQKLGIVTLDGTVTVLGTGVIYVTTTLLGIDDGTFVLWMITTDGDDGMVTTE